MEEKVVRTQAQKNTFDYNMQSIFVKYLPIPTAVKTRLTYIIDLVLHFSVSLLGASYAILVSYGVLTQPRFDVFPVGDRLTLLLIAYTVYLLIIKLVALPERKE